MIFEASLILPRISIAGIDSSQVQKDQIFSLNMNKNIGKLLIPILRLKKEKY